MALTAAAVSKLKTHKVVQKGENKGKATRTEVADGGASGLYLVVHPTGKKSWAVRYRAGSRTRKYTLGPWSDREMEGTPVVGQPLSLAAARQLANEVVRDRAFGRDPAAERQAKKQKDKIAPPALSKFGAAAFEWVEEYAQQKQRRGSESARTLGFKIEKDRLVYAPKGLAERWRDKPLATITADDIHFIVREAQKDGIPGLQVRAAGGDSRARRMRAALSQLFGWLLTERLITSNPVTDVVAAPAAAERERVLTDAEIKAFWTAAGEVDSVRGPALRLLLLLGQRLGEVCGMHDAELLPDRTMWTLPPARTKNKRSHEVPLPPLARELLDSVSRIAGCPYIFSLSGDKPITIQSDLKNRLDARMAKLLNINDSQHYDRPEYEWRLHDLRRTCATGLGDLDVDPHIIEAVLNHVSGTIKGVARTYNRAKYEARKRAALEAWAARLAEIVK